MLQVRAGLEGRLVREGLEEGVVHDELFGVDLRGVEVHELCQEGQLAGPEELHEVLRQRRKHARGDLRGIPPLDVRHQLREGHGLEVLVA